MPVSPRIRDILAPKAAQKPISKELETAIVNQFKSIDFVGL
jgi:hypothetical protein